MLEAWPAWGLGKSFSFKYVFLFSRLAGTRTLQWLKKFSRKIVVKHAKRVTGLG
jgi:hypothetical protein